MRKIIIVLLSVMSLSLTAVAQNKKGSNLTISANGWYGYDIERTRPNLKCAGYMTYEASVGYQTNPNDSNYYSRAYGFPLISVGFQVANMGDFKFTDNTKFPCLYSLFGSFERSLLRTKYVSLGYQFEFGLTYNPERYDPVNNPGNNWLSSPIMAYFGAGAFVKAHLGKRWELGTLMMFRHYSNGRLALPNEALNAIGIGLFARYRLSDYDYRKYRYAERISADFKPGMEYVIALGAGAHSCMAEWNAYVEKEPDPVKKQEINKTLKAHPKFSLSGEFMYRYAPRYATGIGIDLFYSSNMKELEAADRILYGDEAVENCPGYNPFSVGIAIVQEVFWRNFAVHVAIGAYPYRHKGVNGDLAKEAGDRERGWHYEKAGLRYYIPKAHNLFVGFGIKSHSIKAEYLEFSTGIKL